MPHLFQSFWSGPALTRVEELCLKTFIDHGHDFVLYSYDPNISVPHGVTVKNAAEILDPSEFFVYREGFGKGSPAGFANLFRYEMLSRIGGWWVDMDVICLSGSIADMPVFYARQGDRQFNNAILRFPPSHPIVTRCVIEARQRGQNIKWGETGPKLLTEVIDELTTGRDIVNPKLAYPIPVNHAFAVLRPSMYEKVKQAIKDKWFLHLWNQVYSAFAIDKNSPPLPGSFLDSLFIKHGFYEPMTVQTNIHYMGVNSSRRADVASD